MFPNSHSWKVRAQIFLTLKILLVSTASLPPSLIYPCVSIHSTKMSFLQHIYCQTSPTNLSISTFVLVHMSSHLVFRTNSLLESSSSHSFGVLWFRFLIFKFRFTSYANKTISRRRINYDLFLNSNFSSFIHLNILKKSIFLPFCLFLHLPLVIPLPSKL